MVGARVSFYGKAPSEGVGASLSASRADPNTFGRRRCNKTKSSTASLWAWEEEWGGGFLLCPYWDVMVTSFSNWFGGSVFLRFHQRPCGEFTAADFSASAPVWLQQPVCFLLTVDTSEGSERRLSKAAPQGSAWKTCQSQPRVGQSSCSFSSST